MRSSRHQISLSFSTNVVLHPGVGCKLLAAMAVVPRLDSADYFAGPGSWMQANITE